MITQFKARCFELIIGDAAMVESSVGEKFLKLYEISAIWDYEKFSVAGFLAVILLYKANSD